jgi:hypothetical protein
MRRLFRWVRRLLRNRDQRRRWKRHDPAEDGLQPERQDHN